MSKLLKEFPYLYETHMHTEEASRCGKVSGAEMARAAKEYGYTGVFITDHHWGGNTRPDRELPWEEWVDEFCSGYEAAKRIRAMEDQKKAEIPIVAVTANAFEEDRKIALEAGMNGHLAKPYDIDAIMQTLSEILKKWPAHSRDFSRE